MAKYDELPVYKASYDLLHTWKKIPGVDKSGKIDSGIINDWVNKVRKLALKCGRSEVADMHIGKIVAKFPRNRGQWPHIETCKIIESLNSENVNRNFIIEVQNSRGTTTRGAFEGGYQERELAQYFKELSNIIKNTYPLVSSLLMNISNSYLEDAKREDERAKKDELEY